MTSLGRTKTGYLTVHGLAPFEVEMHAFGEGGTELRIVDVPAAEIEISLARDVTHPADAPNILHAIYRYGQNDCHPKPCRSVSVGDIIRLDGKRYRVDSVGFKEVTP